MIVREGGPDDAVAVHDLEQRLFGSEAWSLDTVLGELGGVRRFAVVAVADGAVVGYATSEAADDVVDLNRIAVDLGHQRQGVAGHLLTAVVDHARANGAGRMLLEVGEGNEAARSFYRRSGFSEIHRRPAYYRDGSDALVLQRAVGGQDEEGRTLGS